MEIKKFEKFLEAIVPGGWVNVKVDEQLFIRMSRYVSSLDEILLETGSTGKDKYNLFKKIEILSNIENYISNSKTSIQTKISVITLLQYLKEIKDFFNPSASGFLLEGFLATLIHGKLVKGYKPTDITTSYSDLDAVQFQTHGYKGIKKLDYQIKLYKKGSNIKVNMSEPCDFYVICLKDGDKIEVHILNGKDINDEHFIGGKYAVVDRITGTTNKMDGNTPIVIINTNKLRNNNLVRKLNVGNIDQLIKSCGDSVQDSIRRVYDSLSELHFDIDTLVTGVDKNRERIGIDAAKSKADNTIKQITKEITDLKGSIEGVL
jgi:hypothetical protein